MILALICYFFYLHACSVETCLSNGFYYQQTGDTAKLPLLCHYPVKVCMSMHTIIHASI